MALKKGDRVMTLRSSHLSEEGFAGNYFGTTKWIDKHIGVCVHLNSFNGVRVFALAELAQLPYPKGGEGGD